MADTGSISGIVINIRNNQPIADATINVTGSTTESTKSGGDGSFKLGNLTPANNYAMDISAAGYDSEHYEDIVVIADIDTDLQRLACDPVIDDLNRTGQFNCRGFVPQLFALAHSLALGEADVDPPLHPLAVARTGAASRTGSF